MPINPLQKALLHKEERINPTVKRVWKRESTLRNTRRYLSPKEAGRLSSHQYSLSQGGWEALFSPVFLLPQGGWEALFPAVFPLS